MLLVKTRPLPLCSSVEAGSFHHHRHQPLPCASDKVTTPKALMWCCMIPVELTTALALNLTLTYIDSVSVFTNVELTMLQTCSSSYHQIPEKESVGLFFFSPRKCHMLKHFGYC